MSNTSPTIDPKALGATVTRYVVPAIVGLLVSWAAKAGFTLTSTQAFAYVAPAVATAYSTGLHFAEAKVPALGILLGAKRPASLVKPA
jgi:uncharacterized membrane protein (DUF441 family)